MNNQEIWKPISGYEGIYEVSNMGRVKSLRREAVRTLNGSTFYRKERILKGGRCNWYRTVLLYRDGKSRCATVHRLVADAFLPEDESRPYINHIDNNGMNNRADNLERCTQSENIQYAYDQGRKEGPGIIDIDQLSLDGRYIKTWHGICHAGKTLGIQGANIWKVCKGERTQAGGFKWRYTKR